MSRAEDLAVLAAMELLDLGWPIEDIAAALSRPVAWIEHEIDRTLAAESAASPLH